MLEYTIHMLCHSIRLFINNAAVCLSCYNENAVKRYFNFVDQERWGTAGVDMSIVFFISVATLLFAAVKYENIRRRFLRKYYEFDYLLYTLYLLLKIMHISLLL